MKMRERDREIERPQSRSYQLERLTLIGRMLTASFYKITSVNSSMLKDPRTGLPIFFLV